ncbi:hypothetical protein ACLOAV_005908 [Pseudogymnoascus australis]
MSTNSQSKGLSKEALDKSRAARTKYREKQKSEAIQKAKKVADAAAKEASNLNSLREKVKELQKKYDDGKHPEFKDEYQKASKDLAASTAKVNEIQIVLKNAQKEADTEMGDADAEEDVQKSLFVGDHSSETGEKVLESVEKHTRLLGPDDTNVAGQDRKKRAETPGPDRGTPDFGRWTPEEEDQYYILHGGYTPAQAREAAGIETDGKIVAWASHQNSKPVIVAYGPRNSRIYKRSTAYREADILDEIKIQKFGPGNRYGDKKVDGKLVRKPHEFRDILGVAFNCPVEELIPKPPKKKGVDAAPSARSPRVDIWVKWEINGEIKTSWEVRSSMKHILRSFCDLYIYRAALHYEAQYNLYKSGERTAEDRSPTPFPQPEPTNAQIKQEGKAVNPAPPAFQITKPVNTAVSTALSPIKLYREEWCDLQDIDPKKMTAEDGVNFKLAWDMYQLKMNA